MKARTPGLIFAAAIAVFSGQPAKAQIACAPVTDPQRLIAEVKDELRSGRIDGFALEWKDAVTFVKATELPFQNVRAVLILKGAEDRVAVLFEPADGQYQVCVGEPNGPLYEAIKKLGFNV